MKLYIYLSIALSGITLAISSCSPSAQQDESTKQDTIRVEQAIAKLDTLLEGEVFRTTLVAQAKNNISAQSGGRLRQLFVQVGSKVERGQIIAQLDATQLSTAQIQLHDAKLHAERMEELYKIGGISQAQWEQARSNLAIAQQQVNNIQSNTTLRSPISGFVTAKNYDSGDMTSPSLPIVTIEQINPVKAVVHIPESLYSKVKKGIKAELQTEALGEASFVGYVSNVYPSIDQRTHSIGVEIEFPNKELLLRPGMYGKVRLSLGERVAIVVPDQAIQRSVGSGTKFVYVAKEGKANYRPVVVGERIGAWQEVVSGLEVGESVILSGFGQLNHGKNIK